MPFRVNHYECRVMGGYMGQSVIWLIVGTNIKFKMSRLEWRQEEFPSTQTLLKDDNHGDQSQDLLSH